MGRRRREQAELEALARRVWGDGYYEHYMQSKPRRRFRLQRSRVQAVVGIGVGVPMLLTAALLSLFVTAASAHVSSIDISCTGVQFSYDDFPTGTTATSHEVVSIDGVEVAERDFTFVGPSASDTILISVGSGTHLVEANDAWTFDGRAQGSASDHQHLSYCSSTSTTTAPDTTSTSYPHHETSTSTTAPHSTTSTTKPHNTTSSAPETTTSVPTTATTAPESTTTTVEVTTTTKPSGSTTTTVHGTTSTSSPVHNLGSTTTTTTTTTPVRPHGSTVPPGATSTASPPGGNLPFTGSGRDSLIGGLFAVGVGLLALGLTSLRRGRARSDQ
jgi:hypothetical protein